MTALYLNTNTFDSFVKAHNLTVTTDPAQADFLILGAKKVDYKQFAKIKAVYRFGVGAENVDQDYLKQKGVKVFFPSRKAQHVLFESTANFTVFGILTLMLPNAFGDANAWKKVQRPYLGNKTALVIGTGNIGARVAKKLAAFVNVTTFDVLTNKASELDDLISGADIITCHMPLTPQTKNFFDTKRLGLVKDGALLVNTARGDLFDEQALYEKLTHSTCHAFFDVFWQEPYHGRLKELGPKKFFMTPHSASNTAEFVQEGFNDILNILKEL